MNLSSISPIFKNTLVKLFHVVTSKIIERITQLEDRVDPLHSQMVIKKAVSTKNVIKSKSLAAYPTVISLFL